jgi:ElaB/YqjD/DUF883 family membrane-anchored ribosome-binding protein
VLYYSYAARDALPGQSEAETGLAQRREGAEKNPFEFSLALLCAPAALRESTFAGGATMADPDLGAELEILKDDIAKLREDLAELTDALRDRDRGRGSEEKTSWAELAESLKEEVCRGLEGARERSKKSMETMEQQVEQRPLLSLLAAFGVGLFLGKLFDRS